MLTGFIMLLVAIMVLSFLFIYKKEMVIKMFTLNISTSANEFNEQLEMTADSIIRRLENEAAQLELLLEEAEEKIGMLSQQVEHANKIIEQLAETNAQHKLEQRQASYETPEVTINEPTNFVQDAEEISVASDIIDKLDADSFIDREPNLEKHRLIMDMYHQGYSVTEIAKATGMGKGEIMLFLQLNKK